MTPAQRHMGKVAGIGCILCWHLGLPGQPRVQVHHCFDTEDRSDFLTIPLCEGAGTECHHQGPNGFHGLGEREFNRRYKTSERKLLGLTIARLEGARA